MICKECIDSNWNKIRVYIKNNFIDISLVSTLIFGLIASVMLIFGIFSDRNFLVASSSLFAATTVIFSAYRYAQENRVKESNFYLEKYIQATSIVLELLKSDLPTRRRCWATASEISEKIVSLQEKITSKPDKDFLDIYRISWVMDLIAFINEKRAQYFYGVDDATNFEDAKTLCKNKNIDEKYIVRILKLTNFIWDNREAEPPVVDGKLSYSNLEMNFPELHKYLKDKDVK